MPGKRRKDSEELVRRSISIFKSHDDWLKEHDEINFSEEVRDLIEELMELIKLKEEEKIIIN